MVIFTKERNNLANGAMIAINPKHVTGLEIPASKEEVRVGLTSGIIILSFLTAQDAKQAFETLTFAC
ncbi:hypothetical protein AVT15_gp116 [Pseudomonas phage vB_PaeM_PS24]|uniref:Uncharacterized protein n=1 Tax=Pseudomonas phage vB_PaeM_PS24 TaxID=1542092 RepID=A0A0K0L9G9_9CAUD|nr:hypothetical protein AVT15_gp116 [Pseudomonas phage vB_PaeM_PS24]AIW01790.1 hypothetical protein vB_PaeM_PS2400088 [Pseudomonas phage vB_PaeM_PS24]